MEFLVFSKGVSLKGSYKDGPSEINSSICCGGVIVNPGDIVVGDRDGVVLILYKSAITILKEVELKAREEEIKIKKVENNEKIDKSWIHKKLISKGCKFIKS